MKLSIYKSRGGWHWRLKSKGRTLAVNARPYSTLEGAERGVGSTIVALNNVGHEPPVKTRSRKEYRGR